MLGSVIDSDCSEKSLRGGKLVGACWSARVAESHSKRAVVKKLL